MAKAKIVKPNRLNFDNLTANMHVKLQGFNNEDVVISNETIHSAVVSKTDGFKGYADSATLYKLGVNWTIWAADGNKVAWPTDWLSLSVKDLAEYIISKQKYPEV